jgi:hypothetical protein
MPRGPLRAALALLALLLAGAVVAGEGPNTPRRVSGGLDTGGQGPQQPGKGMQWGGAGVGRGRRAGVGSFWNRWGRGGSRTGRSLRVSLTELPACPKGGPQHRRGRFDSLP